MADLITAISAVRPDAEVIALGLAEAVLANKLSGRGRVGPGEPAYPKAICLALVNGVEAGCDLVAKSTAAPHGFWRWRRK